MKMKRVIALAMALALIFSFSAYGSEVDLSDYEDCEIHFISDGQECGMKYGEVHSATDEPSFVTVGKLPCPEKDGYYFDGWYTETGVKVSEDYVMTGKLLSLYAHWNKKYACGESVYAIFDAETGELTVCGNGPMDSMKNAKSYPWYQFRSDITSLVVEEGVTELGAHAFEGYSGIKKATIPADTVIGKNALKKVTLN